MHRTAAAQVHAASPAAPTTSRNNHRHLQCWPAAAAAGAPLAASILHPNLCVLHFLEHPVVQALELRVVLQQVAVLGVQPCNLHFVAGDGICKHLLGLLGTPLEALYVIFKLLYLSVLADTLQSAKVGRRWCQFESTCGISEHCTL